MCLFTQQNASVESVKNRFSAEIDSENKFVQENEIIGPIFPNVPIILNTTPDLICTNYSWGLMPNLASPEQLKFRKGKLNARIEEIHEKSSYKNITHNRCLIIATGFYEWHWNDSKGKSKTKYLINSLDDEIFTIAGLYTTWRDPNTREIKETYTMLTTKANEIMSYVHNIKKRMPVVIKRKDEKSWLESSIKISEFEFPYEANLKATPLNLKSQYELF